MAKKKKAIKKKPAAKKRAPKKRAAKKRSNPPKMRNLSRGTGWMPADAVRIVKKKGKFQVLIRRNRRGKRK